MSYPTQWTAPNVAPPATNISAQGEVIPNTTIFNAFPSNAQIRHPAPPMHVQINQAHSNQNSTSFCPAAPGGYPFLCSPLMAAFAAQSGAVQSRHTPSFCISQTSPHANAAAAAAAFRGTALLSSTTFQSAPPPPPPAQTQHQLTQLPYFPRLNGIQLGAAFPGAATAPSFPHTPALPQQHAVPFLPTQFRNYDSLKHFGALPQSTNHKKNKSMTTSKTNLYITGLSESDTDETVRALVEDVVCPKSCKAMLLNGKCKGSGFIDCATEEDAVKALNHLVEMSKNGGRQLVVKYALENEKDLLNVYVRNLPKTGFTKETLLNLFRPYGQVTSVKLLETDGAYTGIGFVRFASAEQAQRAVDSMNERRYVLAGGNGNGDSPNGNGSAKPISCKLADKADPKRRAAAAAAAAATGVAAGVSSSSCTGPSRGRFHIPRHYQPPPQQLVCGDLHLQNHQQQQHQTMAAAVSTLSPSQQLQPSLIYQSGMLPDSTGMISAAAAAGGYVHAAANGSATACYPNPPRPPTEVHETSLSVAAAVTNVSTTTPGATPSVAGLLEMPAPQSPPTGHQQQHHLLPQPPPVNGHSPIAAIDSRYAAHLAAAAVVAAAVSSNPVMYSPSNAVVAGTQFPRPTQPPLVQPTYSVASAGVAGHHQHHYAHPNPIDLTADQFQSLTLAAVSAAVRQPQQFYSEWQTAGFQPASMAAGAAAYQPPTSGEAFVDGHSAAAAATLLSSYLQIPHSVQPPPPPPQLSMPSTSPQMVDNLGQQQDQYEEKQKQLSSEASPTSVKKLKAGDDDGVKVDGEAAEVVTLPESDERGKEEGRADVEAEIAASS
ncbi:RNA-binding motif, single-stranded-interacting protein 1 [Echinococcus granulosus]|uniref:RNA binding motif single stranded interacting n=1 Tax=Echinococcus granulosus TaxID=6210 RepID=A0A068WNJ4_ECHGR|nr:RNA-binding motif, single-stranded-interacting protein 1 [Echinococcus granulosus]CDS21315.1 RNA binding motif single stranded interacting [Echinococcus granulosus]